jgi:hypothetical protein
MQKFLVLALLLSASPTFAKDKPGEDPAKKVAEAQAYIDRYNRELSRLSPQELVSALNTPLPDSHSGLRAAFGRGRSYLLLHAFEPGIPLDFRTANGFRESIENHNGLLGASGFDDIGHVFVGWSCDSGAGPVEGMAAMTGERSFQAAKMLKAGWGLTTFLATFTDGHLQPPGFLAEYDAVMEENFDAHVVAIEVSAEHCERARDFVRAYAEHPAKPARNFGLNLDPRKFEGGGCGSFGAAVLEMSGMFGTSGMASHWWRELRPNPRLLGKGLPLPENVSVSPAPGGKRKVAPASLFLGFRNSWDNPKKGGGSMKLLDPEMLQLSLKTIYRRLARPISASDPRLGSEFLRSEIAKLRKVKKKAPVNLEKSNGSFVEVPIDRNFDAKARAVVESTELWIKENNYTARLVRSGKGTAVLMEFQEK